MSISLKFHSAVEVAFVKGFMRASVILLLLLLCYACQTNDFNLSIIDTRSGAIIKRFPMKDGDEFVVKFIHSVVKEPVYESFRIDTRGTIFLKQVKFRKIGVGYGKYIPTVYPLKVIDGWYYMNPNVEVRAPIKYRVGFVAQHTLVVGGEDHLFSKWVEPGEGLGILVEKAFE